MNRRTALSRIAAPALTSACASPSPRSPSSPAPSSPPPAAAGRAPGWPEVQFGRLERWANFASRHVDSRPVDIWLPPSYDGSRAHAVLYMHDGQMLFDPHATWNRQAWQVDRVAAPLQSAGQLREFIVVAPHNNGRWRHAEYYPQKFLPHLPGAQRDAFVTRALLGRPQADAYLRFLVEELKPAIDARYRSLPGPADTALMGSSMGGLISIYGLLEYPQVFATAAALSVHWIATYEQNDEFPAAAAAYLREKLPAPGSLRLYMDRGTTELDALYGPAQDRIDRLLAERGHRPPQVISQVFEGTGHNETAWNARLAIPLRFVFGR